MTTGYHLLSDGTLTAWRQALGEAERTQWSAPHTVADVRRLADDLQQAVPGWHIQETGNMTTRLVLARGDSLWTWTWAGTSNPPDAPEAVVEWLRDFDGITKQTKAK
ncbi:MAG: hypothetical protein VCE12_19970 [Candidatus Latescibacterota bacterium]|jgi:hypothetical protein